MVWIPSFVTISWEWPWTNCLPTELKHHIRTPVLKAIFPHAIAAIHNWWTSADTFIIQVLINSSIKKYSTEMSGFSPEKTRLYSLPSLCSSRYSWKVPLTWDWFNSRVPNWTRNPKPSCFQMSFSLEKLLEQSPAWPSICNLFFVAFWQMVYFQKVSWPLHCPVFLTCQWWTAEIMWQSELTKDKVIGVDTNYISSI